VSIRLTVTQRGLDRIFGSVQRWARRSEGAVERTTGKLAHELRREIVTGIKQQAPGGLQFRPLAESTKAQKGSSKALIDHGDMLRSVNVTKIDALSYFVGIHRSVKGRNGKPMWNIAEIHEFGSKKVTNRPPARPFLRPSYNAWKYDANKRFAEMVAKDIGVPMLGSASGRIGGAMGGVSFGGN